MGNLNSVIFPAPKSSYKIELFNNPEVYQNVPRENNDKIITFPSYLHANKSKQIDVPLLFMPYLNRVSNYSTSLFMVFFHGNAEDILMSFNFMNEFRSSFNMNIIAPEYPEYGAYKKAQISSEQIETDARNLFEWLQTITKLENVFVFGRSIGSGPACVVASEYKIGGLILMSPYTSIKQICLDKSGVIGNLITDRFRNIDLISKLKCPVQFIHGRKDTLIKFQHSQQLISQINNDNLIVKSHFPTEMTHNDYDMANDILIVICNFFFDIDLQYDDVNLFQKSFMDFNLSQWDEENVKPKIKKQVNSINIISTKKNQPQNEQSNNNAFSNWDYEDFQSNKIQFKQATNDNNMQLQFSMLPLRNEDKSFFTEQDIQKTDNIKVQQNSYYSNVQQRRGKQINKDDQISPFQQYQL